VFLAGVAISAGLIIASLAIPEEPADVWPELLKAGVQIGLVGLVASGVTQMLGSARDLREYRLRIFNELAESYTGIKAVRRTLRGLGFRQPSAGDQVTADQADKYFHQMQSLNASQLALERIKRSLVTRSESRRFRSERTVACQVRTVEVYVHNLIEEWEDSGPEIVQGADTKCVRDLVRLQAFLEKQGSTFTGEVAEPMHEIERWLRSRLYGG